MINTLIKWGLRVFAFGHMIEFFLAMYETAYREKINLKQKVNK